MGKVSKMGIYSCDVLTAYSSQVALMGYPEHASCDPEKLATIGRALGHQVRVVHPSNGNKALFTVAELRQEKSDNDIRMCLDGRRRLSDDGATFTKGVCDASCLRSNLTDAEAEAQGEFVERLDEHGDGGLAVLAPHGGAVESYTDEQAERVFGALVGLSKPASCWRCKGWRVGGGAFDAWHITSTDIHPASFPLLNSIEGIGYGFSVAFHGYSEDTVAVGGAATMALKEEVAAALRAVLPQHEVEVVTSGPYAGMDPANICNRLVATGAGIQIEQPYAVRSGYWQAVADAVTAVFAAKL